MAEFTKQAIRDKILKLISGSYTPQSAVYIIVGMALNKMSRSELDSLYVMILTSRNESNQTVISGRYINEVSDQIGATRKFTRDP